MESNLNTWVVQGMTCTHCASRVQNLFEKQGMKDVHVDFASGEVQFKSEDVKGIDKQVLESGIEQMGYSLAGSEEIEVFWTLKRKLIVSALLTLPLMIGHFLPHDLGSLSFIHQPIFQFILALPVFLIGLSYFGKSSYYAVKAGETNMDVLIFLGSSAAFIYSIIGWIMSNPDMYFFETSSSIITLVLLGNWFEFKSVQQTSTAINSLKSLKVAYAQKLDHLGQYRQVSTHDLRPGDQVRVAMGQSIPADGLALDSEVWVDESMVTGESLPVRKIVGDKVIGATLVHEGILEMKVTALEKDSFLTRMIQLVKDAQKEKPPIQRLADRISAWFVPTVLVISALALVLGYYVMHWGFQHSLLNAIAVLVISCPCAMGLATPTAVMVGVGRMAKKGILTKGALTMEAFAQIEYMVFDKTGTLTDSEKQSIEIVSLDKSVENSYSILLALSEASNHPISKTITHFLQGENVIPLSLNGISEFKGKGVTGKDSEGHIWKMGSKQFTEATSDSNDFAVLLSRDGQIVAGVSIPESIKMGAQDLLLYLEKSKIRTILLSGDQEERVKRVSESLGIEEYYAGVNPEEKLKYMQEWTKKHVTAMIGDGINDGPALGAATVGISMNQSTEVAIQSSNLVLLRPDLSLVKQAFVISKATIRTIRQNLFWAFSYNLVAIPLAAFGYLNPMWGAAFMAFSDLVVIGNSLLLKIKRLD
ncbi:MAG: cation-translocating P-type ATPase [Saprospiraceae bacterium]